MPVICAVAGEKHNDSHLSGEGEKPRLEEEEKERPAMGKEEEVKKKEEEEMLINASKLIGNQQDEKKEEQPDPGLKASINEDNEDEHSPEDK